MRRRDFMTILAGAGAYPLSAGAEQRALPLIGLLSPFSRADAEVWHQAFRQGLRDLGRVEGAHVRIEYRYAEGRSERLPELVTELIDLKVDVIVTSVTPDALVAARATKTIPIVMAAPGDPLLTGLVPSLARPGGNITGLSQMLTELAEKRLELLKEAAPATSRVAVLWNPRDNISALVWEKIQLPAQQLGLDLHSLEVHNRDQLENAFTTGNRANALMALPAPIFVVNEKRIADFAVKNHFPSIFHLPEFVHVGGLLAYGPDRADLFRRAATYVDKILRGAKPGDLPIEQPTNPASTSPRALALFSYSCPTISHIFGDDPVTVLTVGWQLRKPLLRRWLVHPNVSDEPRDCDSYARVPEDLREGQLDYLGSSSRADSSV
jgi:putative ABC transport system substrate-binding protein